VQTYLAQMIGADRQTPKCGGKGDAKSASRTALAQGGGGNAKAGLQHGERGLFEAAPKSRVNWRNIHVCVDLEKRDRYSALEAGESANQGKG
jgi:hypothetical protein